MSCQSFDFSLPVAQDVLNLVVYSHVPTIVFSLVVGLFVFFKSGRSLAGRLFLGVIISFSLWLILDVIAWFSHQSDTIMFVWSFFGILYALVYLLSLYFTYVFLYQKDASLKWKTLWGSLLLPIIALTPTAYSLPGFSLRTCDAQEGFFFIAYYYAIGLAAALAILWVAWRRYRTSQRSFRKQMILLVAGLEFFLLSFFVASAGVSFLVHSGYLENFNLEPYGLFGMPVFLMAVAYLIVRYQAFNIRLFATQALVIALLLLSGFQLFAAKDSLGLIAAGILFGLVLASGILLFRSFRLEGEKLALELAHRDLKRIDRAKTEFIDTVSHQLRTPVSIIRGTLSVLLEEGNARKADREQQRHILEGAYRKTLKLGSIVEDIMKVSRVMAGDYKRFETVHVEEIARELVRDFETACRERGVECRLESDTKKIPAVWGEPNALRDAFSNIIDNAIRYTSLESKSTQGTGRRRRKAVVVSVSTQAASVLVKISDQGIGISKSDLAGIFRKFHRGRNARSVYADGTGLGLYIVKEIVRAHHGKVWVESRLGKGSTFFVSLPLKKTKK